MERLEFDANFAICGITKPPVWAARCLVFVLRKFRREKPKRALTETNVLVMKGVDEID